LLCNSNLFCNFPLGLALVSQFIDFLNLFIGKPLLFQGFGLPSVNGLQIDIAKLAR